MSMRVSTPGPSNPTLQWYECKVTLNKGGEDKVYHCNFLCNTALEAQMRSVSMAQAEGAKFVNSQVQLSHQYNNGRAAHIPTPPATTPAPPPAAPAVKELSDKEKRAIRAFVHVPININPTLYVQDEEVA